MLGLDGCSAGISVGGTTTAVPGSVGSIVVGVESSGAGVCFTSFTASGVILMVRGGWLRPGSGVLSPQAIDAINKSIATSPNTAPTFFFIGVLLLVVSVLA
jgi:hypothetical protein